MRVRRALLVAVACNVGFVPVMKDGDEALTRGRLSPVDQTCARTDTHSAANAILIEAQRSIPIVARWGGGLLASVDGLRFVVIFSMLGYRFAARWRRRPQQDQVVRYGLGRRVAGDRPGSRL